MRVCVGRYGSVHFMSTPILGGCMEHLFLGWPLNAGSCLFFSNCLRRPHFHTLCLFSYIILSWIVWAALLPKNGSLTGSQTVSGLKLPLLSGISCNVLRYSVLHAANAFFHVTQQCQKVACRWTFSCTVHGVNIFLKRCQMREEAFILKSCQIIFMPWF